jgi:hypothetical protein
MLTVTLTSKTRPGPASVVVELVPVAVASGIADAGFAVEDVVAPGPPVGSVAGSWTVPRLDVIVTVSGTGTPHVAAALSVAPYGAVFVAVASMATLGYAFEPAAGVTCADGLLRDPDTPVAVVAERFLMRSFNEKDSPGST